MLFFIGMGLISNIHVIIALQVISAFYVGVMFITLLLYVQDSFKGREGFSSSLYFSSLNLASIGSTALVGVFLLQFSFQQSFLLLSIFPFCSVFLILYLDKWRERTNEVEEEELA
ncbi:MFS family permease [Gracilibacillus alcaliphilus]|nr:MFS family permease [Gracilibacillus alcaliphilus]